jgi:hypothetical protein
MLLNVSFGGKCCPVEWGSITKSICNLVNTIIGNNDWDPSSLFALAQSMVPPGQSLPDNIPFGIAKDLTVDIPINPRGMVDLYINNFTGLTVNIEGTDNAARLKKASLLGVSMVAQEVSKFKLLP